MGGFRRQSADRRYPRNPPFNPRPRPLRSSPSKAPTSPAVLYPTPKNTHPCPTTPPSSSGTFAPHPLGCPPSCTQLAQTEHLSNHIVSHQLNIQRDRQLTFLHTLCVLHNRLRKLEIHPLHRMSREVGVRNQTRGHGYDLSLAAELAAPPLRCEELDEFAVLVGALEGRTGVGEEVLG